MSPAALIELRKRFHETQASFAEILGISRRSLGMYEAGTQPIPKTVALACAALAYGLPPLGDEPIGVFLERVSTMTEEDSLDYMRHLKGWHRADD